MTNMIKLCLIFMACILVSGCNRNIDYSSQVPAMTEQSGSTTEQGTKAMMENEQVAPEPYTNDEVSARIDRYYVPCQIDHKLVIEKKLEQDDGPGPGEDYWFVYDLYHRGLNVMLAETCLQSFDDRIKDDDNVMPYAKNRFADLGAAADVNWKCVGVLNFLNVERLTQQQIDDLLSYKGQELESVPEDVLQIVRDSFAQVIKVDSAREDDKEYYYSPAGANPAPNQALVIAVNVTIPYYSQEERQKLGLEEDLASYIDRQMEELEAALEQELDMPVRVFRI